MSWPNVPRAAPRSIVPSGSSSGAPESARLMTKLRRARRIGRRATRSRTPDSFHITCVSNVPRFVRMRGAQRDKKAHRDLGRTLLERKAMVALFRQISHRACGLCRTAFDLPTQTRVVDSTPAQQRSPAHDHVRARAATRRRMKHGTSPPIHRAMPGEPLESPSMP